MGNRVVVACSRRSPPTSTTRSSACRRSTTACEVPRSSSKAIGADTLQRLGRVRRAGRRRPRRPPVLAHEDGRPPPAAVQRHDLERARPAVPALLGRRPDGRHLPDGPDLRRRRPQHHGDELPGPARLRPPGLPRPAPRRVGASPTASATALDELEEARRTPRRRNERSSQAKVVLVHAACTVRGAGRDRRPLEPKASTSMRSSCPSRLRRRRATRPQGDQGGGQGSRACAALVQRNRHLPAAIGLPVGRVVYLTAFMTDQGVSASRAARPIRRRARRPAGRQRRVQRCRRRRRGDRAPISGAAKGADAEGDLPAPRRRCPGRFGRAAGGRVHRARVGARHRLAQRRVGTSSRCGGRRAASPGLGDLRQLTGSGGDRRSPTSAGRISI